MNFEFQSRPNQDYFLFKGLVLSTFQVFHSLFGVGIGGHRLFCAEIIEFESFLVEKRQGIV